jgi:hypothetical protein
MYIVERDSENEFGLTVINTGEGNDYHPLYRGHYPKEKRRAAIRIGNISFSHILQEVCFVSSYFLFQ